MSWLSSIGAKVGSVINANKKGIVKTVAGGAGFLVGGPGGAAVAYKTAGSLLSKNGTTVRSGAVATTPAEIQVAAVEAAQAASSAPATASALPLTGGLTGKTALIAGGAGLAILVVILVVVMLARRR